MDISSNNFSRIDIISATYTVMDALNVKLEDPKMQPIALATLLVAMCNQLGLNLQDTVAYGSHVMNDSNVHEERMTIQALYDFIEHELNKKLI